MDRNFHRLELQLQLYSLLEISLVAPTLELVAQDLQIEASKTKIRKGAGEKSTPRSRRR
jgi:hypothetical protein